MQNCYNRYCKNHILPPEYREECGFNPSKSRLRITWVTITGEFVFMAPINVAVIGTAGVVVNKIYEHIQHFFCPDIEINLSCCEAVCSNHLTAKEMLQAGDYFSEKWDDVTEWFGGSNDKRSVSDDILPEHLASDWDKLTEDLTGALKLSMAKSRIGVGSMPL